LIDRYGRDAGLVDGILLTFHTHTDITGWRVVTDLVVWTWTGRT